jgi:hypothetical protein
MEKHCGNNMAFYVLFRIWMLLTKWLAVHRLCDKVGVLVFVTCFKILGDLKPTLITKGF